MSKIVAILVVVGILLLTGVVRLPQKELVSPEGGKEEQSVLQKIIDQKIFDANKNKVVAKPIDWARGYGHEVKPHPTVNEGAYIVVDGRGDVVFGKSEDEKRPPASLTKLVTAMVVLDLTDGTESFEVQKESVNLEPTILMVDEGEKLPVGELLKAMLITSANDAADVAARGVAKKLGGSQEVFVMLMNEKAKNLGLTKTRFANATGYDDDNQYSTPRELAKIAYYAITQYPEIADIVKTKEAEIEETKEHKHYSLPNWNALLGVYPGVDGVKIGHTEKAGYSTAVTATRNDVRIMVVLLNGPDRRARDVWTADLLNSAFLEQGIRTFRVTRLMLQKREEEWTKQLQKAQEFKSQFGWTYKRSLTKPEAL